MKTHVLENGRTACKKGGPEALIVEPGQHPTCTVCRNHIGWDWHKGVPDPSQAWPLLRAKERLERTAPELADALEAFLEDALKHGYDETHQEVRDAREALKRAGRLK